MLLEGAPRETLTALCATTQLGVSRPTTATSHDCLLLCFTASLYYLRRDRRDLDSVDLGFRQALRHLG